MVPNLQPQSKWRWLVAAYLFLAGLGGGAYVTGVVADFLGPEWATISKIGVALGFPCVAVGCVFLLLDLGTPKNFWRAGMRPNTSWIARGTIIITIFMVLAALHIALWIWPFQGLEEKGVARGFLGILGVIFAFGTMIYTGILLGAARPIAFWSTAMLPLLFLVSALSTGIMAVVLLATFAGATTAHAEAIRSLARFDMLLIILELFVLTFYLHATHRVPESRASAELVLTGAIAPLFWIGVGLLGLLVPLLLDVLGEFLLPQDYLGGLVAATMALLASVCGIIGGLCLRQVVVAGGIHAPIRAGRFEIGLPIV